MQHTYEVTGMTCSSCEAKVKEALMKVENVTNAVVSKADNSATITMEQRVSLAALADVLPEKYKIRDLQPDQPSQQTSESWIITYKPVLLIFVYIAGVTFLVQLQNESFDLMEWMRHFMAGFFLVFSFFKMLNLREFANSYVMYDVVARKFPVWAYLYAFTEVALGIAFLINFNPLITNLVTLVVMGVSIIGVLQSVYNKKQIQCACLGSVFNLPMSTVTIVEDGLMILMSLWMLMNM